MRNTHSTTVSARLHILLPGLMALLLPPGSGHADEPVRQKAPLTLGIATAYPASPYRGIGVPPSTTAPFARYEGDAFYLRGFQIGYRLNNNRRVNWSLYLRPRLQGYRGSDSDVLAGMDTRHNSIDGGLQFDGHLTRRWSVRARAGMDTLWVHQGHETELTLSHRWPVSERLTLLPSLGMAWQSAKLVDYYYGVGKDEVDDPDRPAYEGEAARNPYVQLGANYRFTRTLSLYGQAQVSQLDDTIRDSPLVDQDHEVSGLIALSLAFY